MVRFIHAADIHLDSPLKGLANRPHLPADKIKDATRNALTNLVNLALSENVDFVLLAGDIYDGDWDDTITGFEFIREMGRLSQKNIPVVMIFGNHDAISKISQPLTPPKNLKILRSDSPESFEIIKDGEVIAIIHGQSFKNQAETRNLATTYPAPVAGKLNIGILHTSLDGRIGHDNYAPTTKIELINKGYSYWALGHVHTREEVHQKPYIIFPGNIQGRHIRETGAKGCYLVTFKDNHEAQLDFKPLDVFRWEVLSLNLTNASNKNDLEAKTISLIEEHSKIYQTTPVGIRITLEGSTVLHSWLKSSQNYVADIIQSIFTGISTDKLFLEQLKVKTSDFAFDQPQEQLNEDVLHLINQSLKGLIDNPDEFDDLIKKSTLESLNRAIPGDWKKLKDDNSIEPMKREWLESLFSEIVPVMQTIAKNEEKKS